METEEGGGRANPQEMVIASLGFSQPAKSTWDILKIKTGLNNEHG